jgi:hypothetical protein
MRLVRLASSRSSGGLAICVVVLWCAFVAGAGVDAARADTAAPADMTGAAPTDTTGPASADPTSAPADTTGPASADPTSAPADTTGPASADPTSASADPTSAPADTTGPAPVDAPPPADLIPAPADTPPPADTIPAPADTTEAPATQPDPRVAPIVVTVAQTVNPSVPVTPAPGLVRSTASAGQPVVGLRRRLSWAAVSGPRIAPAAAAAWPLAVVGGSGAPAGFWVAHGFGPAAQRSPVRVGGLESATASPRARNSAESPASQRPSEPGGASGASTGSSVASGGSSSASGALFMILLAELGLASWGLYKLLISPAGWRSLTFISLLERPG